MIGKRRRARITFVDTGDNKICIGNGFSFVHHFFEADDYFVDIQGEDPSRLEKILRPYGAIYCSVLYFDQLSFVSGILDKRWFIGGPLVEWLPKTKAHYVFGPFEFWVQKPLSAKFTSYWGDSLRNAQYGISPGVGCYWTRCTFCYRESFEGWGLRMRWPLEGMFLQLRNSPGDHASIAMSSTTVPVLYELAQRRPPDVTFDLMVRADPFVVRAMERMPHRLDKVSARVGLECAGQGVLDELDKGIKPKDAYALAKAFLDRGAEFKLMVIRDLPMLLDKPVTDEEKEALTEVMDWGRRMHPGKLTLGLGSRLHWPTEEIASRYGKPRRMDKSNIGFGFRTELTDEVKLANAELEKFYLSIGGYVGEKQRRRLRVNHANA